MIALDLFCCAGGASLGLHALGLNVVGVDHDPDACNTHLAAGWPTFRADLTAPPPVHDDYDLIWASPPCTAFSMAGKGAGREVSDELVGRILAEDWTPMDGHDPCVWLVLPTMRALLDLAPTAIGMENVPPTLPVMRACAQVLERHGWHAAVGVLSAEAFGVAQTRKRAFLIANRERRVAMPEPTHQTYGAEQDEVQGMLFGDVLPGWVSMADALGWTGCHESAPWVHDRPATTLVSSFRPDVVAGPGYRQAGDGPRQDAPGSIRITVAEAARLQAFPHDHPWCGSRTSQFRQIGNAVPPPVAIAVAGAALAVDWHPAHTAYLDALYATPITTRQDVAS